jgi:hypothetical protein
MVQWLARLVYTEKVAGSNPAVDSDSIFVLPFHFHDEAPVAQWIRRRPSKPEVVGSIPTGGVLFLEKKQDGKRQGKSEQQRT